MAHGRLTRAVLRRWWVVPLAMATAVGVGATLTARETPRYRASAQLVVVPNTRLETNTDIMRGLETLERRTVVATFAKVAAARESRDEAAARLGLEAAQLAAYSISAAVLPNTNLINIDVSGPDKERVAAVANSVAALMRVKGRRLYRIYSLDIVTHAVPAYRPYHPDARRNLMVAGLIGLFLGLVSAGVVEALVSE